MAPLSSPTTRRNKKISAESEHTSVPNAPVSPTSRSPLHHRRQPHRSPTQQQQKEDGYEPSKQRRRKPKSKSSSVWKGSSDARDRRRKIGPYSRHPGQVYHTLQLLPRICFFVTVVLFGWWCFGGGRSAIPAIPGRRVSNLNDGEVGDFYCARLAQPHHVHYGSKSHLGKGTSKQEDEVVVMGGAPPPRINKNDDNTDNNDPMEKEQERALIFRFHNEMGQGMGQGVGGASMAYAMALACGRNFYMDFALGPYKLEDVLAYDDEKGEASAEEKRWWWSLRPEHVETLKHSKVYHVYEPPPKEEGGQKGGPDPLKWWAVVDETDGKNKSKDAVKPLQGLLQQAHKKQHDQHQDGKSASSLFDDIHDVHQACHSSDLKTMVVQAFDYFPEELMHPRHFPKDLVKQTRWKTAKDVEQDASGCAWPLLLDPPPVNWRPPGRYTSDREKSEQKEENSNKEVNTLGFRKSELEQQRRLRRRQERKHRRQQQRQQEGQNPHQPSRHEPPIYVAHLRVGDAAYAKGAELRGIVKQLGSVRRAAEASLKCLDESYTASRGRAVRGSDVHDEGCVIYFVSDSREARDYALHEFKGRHCKVQLTEATDSRPDVAMVESDAKEDKSNTNNQKGVMSLGETRQTLNDFYLMWQADRLVITSSTFSCGAAKTYVDGAQRQRPRHGRQPVVVYRLEDELKHGTHCRGLGHRRDFNNDVSKHGQKSVFPPAFVSMAGSCRMNDEFVYNSRKKKMIGAKHKF